MLPRVQVRVVETLPELTCRVLVRGAEVGRGVVVAGRVMAVHPGGTAPDVDGIAASDPSFGLPARWIEPAAVDAARSAGLVLVDAATVVVTQLEEVMRRHAATLFGREEALALLDTVRAVAPRTVAAVFPAEVSPAAFTRIARQLVQERVPLTDVRGLVDALADVALMAEPPAVQLTAQLAAARRRLGAHVVGPLLHSGALRVLVLDEPLERALRDAVVTVHGEATLQPPGTIASVVVEALRARAASGDELVVVAPPDLRRALFDFVERFVGGAHVLALTEVPAGVDVVIAGRIALAADGGPAVH
jgi:flagellar biosynthesis protein FlhA